jgi:signal transduction histidine kinase/CheY-like chemotaxis protein
MNINKNNTKQLIFIFLIFVLMVTASYLSVSIIVRNHLVSEAKEVLRATEANIETSLLIPEAMLANSAFSVQDMIEKGASQEEVLSYLINLTDKVLGNGGRITIFNEMYGFIRGEYLDGLNWKPPEDFVPEERPWYLAAAGKGGEIAFTVPFVDARTGGMIISYSQELFSSDGAYLGILAIDMDLNKSAAYDKPLRRTKAGYVMLLNQNMEIMVHPVDRFLGQSLASVNADCAEIAKRLAEEGSVSAFHVKQISGSENSVPGIVFFKTIFNGWTVGIITPIANYYRDVYITGFMLSILGIIFMVSLMYLLMRLNKAKVRSDEENKSKSVFLARMSHEIRTPMHAIIGMDELILRENLNTRIMEYAISIKQSGLNLLAIINEILDFSKIESGKLEIVNAEYQFRAMLKDCVSITAMRLREKQADGNRADSSRLGFSTDVDSALPDTLSGDVVRIRQIILNLLSNAVKFTHQGKIVLAIKSEAWTARDGEKSANGEYIALVIKVSDTGIGIREEDFPHLFGEFTQFDSKKNYGIEGTGLGLAVSRNLCRLMGGDITVKSEYGKGSVFTAVIPQQVIAPSSFKPPEPEKSPNIRFTAQNASILIVDDLELNLRVAKGLLSRYKMDITLCLSGKEAVELVKHNTYDLILMDHMMPEMDGIEAVAHIRKWEAEQRKEPTGSAVPIIAFTANAISGMKELFLEKGFNDFISKPVEVVKLDGIIARWLPREKQAAAGIEREA